MEERRIDFLVLKKKRACQNKGLSEQEGGIQAFAEVSQDKPALSIKMEGTPGA